MLAMRVLADAVAAAPKALLANFLGATPAGRRKSHNHQAWHAVLSALEASEDATMKHMGASGDATAQAAPSITLSKTPTSLGLLMPSRGGERGISLRDTVSSGVAHPASSAHATVTVLCNTLSALLRIDGVVRCGAGGRLCLNAKGTRSVRKNRPLIRRGNNFGRGSGSDGCMPHSPNSSDEEES